MDPWLIRGWQNILGTMEWGCHGVLNHWGMRSINKYKDILCKCTYMYIYIIYILYILYIYYIYIIYIWYIYMIYWDTGIPPNNVWVYVLGFFTSYQWGVGSHREMLIPHRDGKNTSGSGKNLGDEHLLFWWNNTSRKQGCNMVSHNIR